MKQPIADLWRAGVPLAEAWCCFAPKAKRTAFEAAPRLSDALGQPQSNQQAGARSRAQALAELQGLAQSWLQGLEYDRARDAMADELRERLLDGLFNGRFIAIGYRVASRPSRRPEPINADYFDNPNIDWRNSAVTACGITYANVRVIRRSKAFPTLSRSVKRGRPSHALAINAAIIELKAQDAEYCRLPRKIAADQLRMKLGVSAMDKGYGEKTLHKYISAHCPARKS